MDFAEVFQVNAFVKNIFATVIAAGIVANVAILFQFNARLARIETILELRVAVTQPQIAKIP